MDKFVARIGRSRVLTINFIAHALIARINIKLLILATRYDYNEISGPPRDPMINGIRINSGQRNYRWYANKKKIHVKWIFGRRQFFCGLAVDGKKKKKKNLRILQSVRWIVVHTLSSCCATTICFRDPDRAQGDENKENPRLRRSHAWRNSVGKLYPSPLKYITSGAEVKIQIHSSNSNTDDKTMLDRSNYNITANAMKLIIKSSHYSL